MLSIHPNARTTPAVRAEIAHSPERTGVLAQRYGVSMETIRKWRKRGPGAGADRSSRPHRLRWRATADEQRIICLLRQETRFALDDLAAAVRHFRPHPRTVIGPDTVRSIRRFLREARVSS